MQNVESFTEKLARTQAEAGSMLCVGLDPDPARLPPSLLSSFDIVEATRVFCLRVIDATMTFASAFKINFAFFEALGPEGWHLLKEVSDKIPSSKIRIADAKRGDIGNTGRFYAKAVFEQMNFDACTVAPYMGASSIQPFLQYPEKAAFVLARTSNPDAETLQLWPSERDPLFKHVAKLVNSWSEQCPGTAGLVVGATDVESVAALRELCPRSPFLVPGIGAQGGDLAEVIKAGLTDGGALIINSSRSILYASDGHDFADAAAAAARQLAADMRAATLS